MKKQIQKTLSNTGFTLVEMMVASGILSIVLLGFSGYMFYQSKMTGNQNSIQNYNYVESNVMKAAGQPDTLLRSEILTK